MVASVKQTSLEKLQSFSEKNKSLESQLSHALSILKCEEHDAAKFTALDWSNLSSVHVTQGRGEWALRWALRKLQDIKVGADEATAVLGTLRLLGVLVKALPPSKLARHLSDHQWLTSLARILHDAISTSTAVSASPPYEDPTGDDLKPQNELSGGKRKRDKALHGEKKLKKQKVETSRSNSRDIDEHTKALIFAAFDVIVTVQEIAHKVELSEDSLSCEHIREALRTDVRTAAMLLQGALRFKSQLFDQQDVEQDARLHLDSEARRSIIPFTNIWRARGTLRQESTSSPDLFAEVCLNDALVFISKAKFMLRSSTEKDKQYPELSTEIEMLELLMAQHIVTPSRSDFTANQSQEEDPNPLLLRRLVEQAGNLLEAKRQPSQNSDPSELAILFEVFVKQSHVSVPKRRHTELRWLQVVLDEFLRCIQARPAKSHELTRKHLLGVLEVSRVHKVVPRHETALMLADGEARLGPDHADDEPVHEHDWQLIAILVDLVPEILTGRGLTSQHTENEGHSVLRVLRGRIRLCAAIRKAPELDAIGDTRPGMIAGSGAEAQTQKQNVIYQIIVDRILIPLIDAFAAAHAIQNIIEVWFDELRLLASQQRISDDRSPWEDYSLILAVARAFEKSTTSPLASSIIEHYVGHLRIKDPETSPAQALAASTVIYALLHDISDAELVPLFGSLSEVITSCASLLRSELSGSDGAWQIWRLLGLAFSRAATICDSNEFMKIFLHVKDLIQPDEHRATTTGSHNRVQRLSCIGVVATCARFRHAELPSLDPIFQALPPYHGRHAMGSTATAMQLTAVIAAHHELLSFCSADVRQEWFRSLLEACCTNTDLLKITTSLFHALCSSDSPLLESLTQAISWAAHNLYASKAKQYAHAKAFESVLSILPARILSRHTRETLLDAAVQRIHDESYATRAIPHSCLAMMIHLTSQPCFSSKLVSEPGQVIELAQTLSKAGGGNTQRNETSVFFQQTLYNIIELHISNVQEERSWRFLENIWKETNMLPWATITHSPELITLLLEVLSYPISVVDHLDIDMSQYEKSQLDVLKKTCDDTTQDSDLVLTLRVKLISDLPVGVLNTNRNSVLRLCERLQAEVITKDIAAYLWSINARLQVAQGVWPSIADAEKLLTQAACDNALTDKLVSRAFNEFLTEADASIADEFLQTLLPLDRLNDDFALGRWRLIFLLCSSASLQKIWSDHNHANVFVVAACEQLANATEKGRFVATCSVIVALLQNSNARLNQHTLEIVLKTLATTLSTSAPQFGGIKSTTIFANLSNVMRALLVSRRRALKGRYDLVALVLQGFLRCLFVNDPAATGVQNRIAHPPWLVETRSQRRGKPELTAKEAETFVRLVTLICEPTVSAVSRNKKEGLVDETAKARAYAGQYMPSVVEEYCQCVLRGRIDQQSRKALMPGIYAMLNAIAGAGGGHGEGRGKEQLEAMSESLNAAGRSMLRRLVADWRQFGVWKKT